MKSWHLVVSSALLAVVACKPSDKGTVEDTGIEWPDPHGFQLTGEAGSVVVTQLETPENPVIEVFGIFASDTQDYVTAAACAQFAMPCVETLPEEDEFRRLDNANFRPRRSEYRWVGDDISVGPIQAGWMFDDDREMAFYHGRSEGRLMGTQTLRFAGEWADFSRPAVEFVDDFTVTGPILEPDQRLDFSQGTVEFTWESDGRQEVWFWIEGPQTRRVYRLEDDGEFTLDPLTLNLGDAEVVRVGLAAARRKSYDVAGNALDVLSLSGAGWKGSACGDFLDVVLEGSTLPDGDPPVPIFMGWSFRGIIDENIHDFYNETTGEPESARLTFTFYDAAFQTLCDIEYDASAGRRAEPLVTDTGAHLFQTYEVALFNGLSTCPQVDGNQFGFTDLRTYVEQFEWSFAFGEMVDLTEPLSEAFEAAGIPWENQEPFINSVYWSQDGLFADEQGFGFGFETPTCYQSGGFPMETLDPDEPMPAGFYTTQPYIVELVR